MWIEDVLYGALANGVNKPTILALNAALLGCILSLLALLTLSITGAPSLVPHVAFLLFLAVGLLFLINWFIQQVGVVETEDQRKELFGDAADTEPAADTQLAPAVTEPAQASQGQLKED